MRVLTHQPFSIHAIGGGARILRRLFEGCEKDVVSLCLKCSSHASPSGPFVEREVSAFPLRRRWHRGLPGKIFDLARTRIFREANLAKVRRVASAMDFDVLHVVAHGRFNSTFCNPASRGGKPLWVSFHDHWITGADNPADIKSLWRAADRRFVISSELGERYSNDFGSADWTILSDGVADSEFQNPRSHDGKTLNLYFGGMLHVDYYPLFEAMADALDRLADQGWQPVMHLRGTQRLPFMQGRRFETRQLPATLSDDELRTDHQLADILYLPIGFSMPHFYLHSLSTKMVGYLAAPGAILFHGPLDSAAARLLRGAEAAAFTDSLKPELLANALLQAASQSFHFSSHAKSLAKERFNLAEMRARFWNLNA
jgi:hypothetical protein